MTADPAVAPRTGLPRIDGVLLDIDDTLVDTQTSFAAAMSAVARRYLPAVPPDRDRELLATWRTDARGYYRRFTRGELGFLDQRRERAAELHRAFGGPPVTEALFAEWNEVFLRAFEGAWAAHPDAVPLLAALDGAGVRFGAVTNALAAAQDKKLTRVGLRPPVEVLVAVDTLGYGKPDPRVFRAGARALGLDPAHVLYVGDELDVDARGAADAGLVGVWLRRDGDVRRDGVAGDELATDGVVTVAGLDELSALVAASRA